MKIGYLFYRICFYFTSNRFSFLLEKVPEPNKEDIEYKSERVPLDATSRKSFFNV